MKLTNTELMLEIERTQRLLSSLEAERERRRRSIEDECLDVARFAARDAISKARLALSSANDALDAAEEAGDSAEVERINRDVLPGLRAALAAAIDAGREVLL